jgi:tripartite-type tricarboxylate transporter receptor subunit TctC
MTRLTSRASRRQFIKASGAGAAALLAAPFVASRGAYAAWPDRPVRIVVPFAPGGPADVTGRVVQAALTEELKGQFFVDNKPGATGNIGVREAARAEPDGYTVLVTSNTLVINPMLFLNVQYDPVKDFRALVDIAGSPTAYAVQPSLGVNTVAEFVALAKQRAGSINYGHAGHGTPAHLAGEFFKRRGGFEMTPVPFNGAGPAIQALLGGQVHLVSAALPGAHPHIKAGTLKGLAVTGEKRWFDLPDVPTMVEAGYPGFVLDTYVMMLVPAKTPQDIGDKLAQALITGLKKPENVARLRAAGMDVTAGGPDALKARIARELPLWREVVDAAGIQPR